MAKILVLGSTGMLGSMIHKYLSRESGHSVASTVRQKTFLTKKNNTQYFFDANDFLLHPNNFVFLRSAEYIINCIGIIKPHCNDNNPVDIQNAIQINALFPWKLAEYCTSSKILQIATDCVYSGTKGNYTEDDKHDALDVYGKTKSLGEIISPNVLNIRCSIIGPERKTSYSLLEWFLHQPEGAAIQGFTNHLWNGVTTLQFAKLCLTIIDKNLFDGFATSRHVYHFVPNTAVTKYQLLVLFQKIFRTKCTITASTSIGPSVNRTLGSQFPNFTDVYGYDSMENAIEELKKYINNYEKI